MPHTFAVIFRAILRFAVKCRNILRVNVVNYSYLMQRILRMMAFYVLYVAGQCCTVQRGEREHCSTLCTLHRLLW